MVSEVNTSRYTSWKDGIINFYNLNLEEVVMRLETRYNQKFEYDAEVKDNLYTFTIKNEPLHEILRLMENITPIKAEQKDELITIKLDKNKKREVERQKNK